MAHITSTNSFKRPLPDTISEKAIVDALAGNVPAMPSSVGYKLALLLVAAAVLVLPVIYLAIVALVGWGTVWWAINAGNIIRAGSSAGLLGSLIVGAPILSGVVLILFMFRPILARSGDSADPVVLRPSAESLLYAFVYRLCDLVGAPRPARIDVDCEVNASASFKGGVFGVLRRQLVLTIGLPLVTCLDLRQFAGILAHEMGHFTQGGGMRLSYLIRRINLWFLHAVYYRDRWDRALTRLSTRTKHPLWLIAANLARFFLFITRRILWLLMIACRAISAALQRQMEFDADRYQILVVGSRVFVQTADRVPMINLARRASISDLMLAFQEKRLADNLPAMIATRHADMPSTVCQSLLNALKGQKERWFDSHPVFERRCARALEEHSPGILKLDLPASVLFHDLTGACRQATIAEYRAHIGKHFSPGQIVATKQIIEHRQQRKETYDSLQRYFQNLIDPRRPVFPEAMLTKIESEASAAERLLELRSMFVEASPSARAAAKEFTEYDNRAGGIAALRTLKTTGLTKIKFPDPKLRGSDDDALRIAQREARACCERTMVPITKALTLGLKRLELALAVQEIRQRPAEPSDDPARDFGEYDLVGEAPEGSLARLLGALMLMKSVASSIAQISRTTQELRGLLAHARPTDNPEGLVSAAVSRSRRLSEQLREAHALLREGKYPYSHNQKDVSLAHFICEKLPPPERIPEVLQAGSDAIAAYFSLYMRLMSDLAKQAEEVENSLGLPPLEKPAHEAEPPAIVPSRTRK